MIQTLVVTFVLVIITVIIHYEVLRELAAHVEDLRLPVRVRVRMALVMLAIIATHIVEIVIFAIGMYIANRFLGIGALAGVAQDGLFGDYLYFSLVSYTTLGFGDIYPTDGLRLITGIEALTGLLMITWSASFTFLYMEKFWRLGHGSKAEDE
jgi:hypothetical protein